MKILFLSTRNPSKQGDLLEICILNGLRKILGFNCIDYPRKKIMYHDWSETEKDSLHGRGFNLLTHPIEDISNEYRNNFDDIDFILYGCGWIYGENAYTNLEQIVDPDKVWYLDSHDLYGIGSNMIEYNNELVIGNQKYPSFKREMIIKEKNIYSTGLGIPAWSIFPLNFENKTQLYQLTSPDDCLFKPVTDLGNRKGHKFLNENEYNDDIRHSWFGLTCLRGGWDSLRIYEIISNGALLLFKDYDKKPPLCSPQNLPCYSYSTLDELNGLFDRLLVNGKPTREYLNMLNKQRTWLINNGTCEARALHILNTLKKHL